MILFIVLLSLLLVSVIAWFIFDAIDGNTCCDVDTWIGISAVTAIVVVFALIVMLVFLPINLQTMKAEYLAMQEEYDVLYQLSTSSDGSISDSVLALRVTDYNSRVIHHQYWANNKWVGVFTPNCFNDLKLISFNG